jgi:dTDP-4-amino-4,6-dideoxygalactose transaminase
VVEHNLCNLRQLSRNWSRLQIFWWNYQKIWNNGNFGVTSFFPSKNLGCYGDGGAIFTNDDDLAYKIRGIVNHGMYKRYYHDEVGVNSRLDSVQAAVLRVKLPLLDSYNA